MRRVNCSQVSRACGSGACARVVLNSSSDRGPHAWGSGGRARCVGKQQQPRASRNTLEVRCWSPRHIYHRLCSPVTMCCRRRGPSVTPPSMAIEAPVLGGPESVHVCVSHSSSNSRKSRWGGELGPRNPRTSVIFVDRACPIHSWPTTSVLPPRGCAAAH